MGPSASFRRIKSRSHPKSCVFRLNEHKRWYTNEKWLYLLHLMYLAHPEVKDKINIMKPKLENKEPLFHDKIHFQCKNG